MAKKQLRRGQDPLIAGVCSGFAEYFDLDVTTVRLLWAILTLFTVFVPGVVIYIICWIVMPEPK